MAVFGKKGDNPDPSDGSDFVRIPQGTQLAAGTDGKLKMSFAGDMSFGETIPELSELVCGRNLSIDPGVTIKADVVRVNAALEIEEGARLVTRELEAERLVSRKGNIEARTISAGRIEWENSNIVADRVTTRENVFIDRGTQEIGTVVAQTLTVTKGTNANILIREVAKLDGFIPKGGYENFDEFLTKVYQYHPELLNDQFSAEARKLVPAPSEDTSQPSPAPEAAAAAPAPSAEPDVPLRLADQAQKLKSLYTDKEMPKEMGELVGQLEGAKVDDLRRDLTPLYQKLTAQGKMPQPVMDVFRNIQQTLRETARPAVGA